MVFEIRCSLLFVMDSTPESVIVLDNDDSEEEGNPSAPKKGSASKSRPVCCRKPKECYEEFFSHRRSEDAIRKSRSGKLIFGLCLFCYTEETNFDSFTQFKNHILTNHSDQPVLYSFSAFLLRFHMEF